MVFGDAEWRGSAVQGLGSRTHVVPLKSVGFTWGCHYDQDQRGQKSCDHFGDGEGEWLVVGTGHRELADAEAAANHNQGWTSSLRKLEAVCK